MWIIIGIIVVLFLILITIIGYADKPQKPVVRPPKEDHRDDWPKSSIKTNTRNYNESSNCCVDKIDSDELIIEFVGKIGEAKVENMLFSIKEKHYSYV